VTQPSRLDRRPGAANHYPAAFLDALAARIRELAATRRTTLIAIDGWGCGGKTSPAEGLFDRLEPEVTYLGMDEFFLAYPFPDLDPFPVSHLRWDEVEATINALHRDGQANPRLFNWNACVIDLPQPIGPGIIVVEGLFSLHHALRDAYDLKIWVQSHVDSRAARVTVRDGAEMVSFWEEEWAHREAAFFAQERPWEHADLVVAGAGLEVGQLRFAIANALDPDEIAPSPKA
jgi:uridine kinase